MRRNTSWIPFELEASVTQDPQVNLYIYGDWSEVRLRNDEENWSDWLPFHNSLTWNLPMSNGEHLVTAEMRNGEASATSQDTIVLTGMTTMPEIGNLPDIITFTYSLIDQQFIPESTTVIPLNVGSSDPLQWQITTDSLSFVVSPTQGLTPEVFSIVPIEPTTLPKVIDTNTVTVTAETAEGMLCEPFVFSVIINVTDGVIHKLYMPLLSIQIQ